MRSIYLLGGPNGAGKTTTALRLLPETSTSIFVNADAIAAGLAPTNPQVEARAAARLMLARLNQLAMQDDDFMIESTLSSRMLQGYLSRCRERGFSITIVFLWLQSADEAVRRVAKRVAAGGHAIPEEVIRRRYQRSQINFLQSYAPLAQHWTAVDNTGAEPALIATGGIGCKTEIFCNRLWKLLGQTI